MIYVNIWDIISYHTDSVFYYCFDKRRSLMPECIGKYQRFFCNFSCRTSLQRVLKCLEIVVTKWFEIMNKRLISLVHILIDKSLRSIRNLTFILTFFWKYLCVLHLLYMWLVVVKVTFGYGINSKQRIYEFPEV